MFRLALGISMLKLLSVWEWHVGVDFFYFFCFLHFFWYQVECGLESRLEHTQLDDSSDGEKGPKQRISK